MSAPRIKIAVLSGHCLDIGGVETQLGSLLRHASAERYEWVLCAPTSPIFATRIRNAGAQVAPWKPRSALDPLALVQLIHILRIQRVNLLHIHSPNAALIGAVAGRYLGIPVVITIHLPAYTVVRGHGFHARARCWLAQWAERLAQRAATAVIYVSATLYHEALRLKVVSPAHTVVIENGIELEPWLKHPLSTQLKPSPIVISYVGRLDYQKGLDVLLHALALLLDTSALNGNSMRLRLLGTGPQQARLETLATQLGVASRVEFNGDCPDVPSALRESDIFVLPSRYEAMSMSLLEAMASGLPCVVTGVGENACLVEDEQAGLVVPPEEPTALAQALTCLIKDPSLRYRLGQAARRKAAQYDAQRMTERTYEIYETILQ